MWSWNNPLTGNYFPQGIFLPLLNHVNAGSNGQGNAGMRSWYVGQYNGLKSKYEQGTTVAPFYAGDLDLWYPMGSKYGGATGGTEIHLTDGHAYVIPGSRHGYLYQMIEFVTRNDRQSNFIYKGDGEPIRYEDLIVHISQGDIVPWRYFGDTDPEYGCPGYGKCDPFGYRFAPNFQTNYVNQNNLKSPDSDLIAGYSDEDDQHKIRNTRNAMALVWSANDAFAKDDLKMHAEQTHAAMSTLPMGYTNNGPVYNGGLFGSNGIGTGYGRGQAHPTQVFAAAYATSRDDAWRATKKSIWFDRLVNDKLAKSQVPCSGIIGVNKNKNTQNEANAAAGNEMGMAANAMRSVLYRVYKNFDQTNAQTLQGVMNKHYYAFIRDINDPSNPYSWKHSSSAPRVTIIVADENTPANVYCNWDDIPLQFQAYSNVGIATYEPQYAMAYGKLDTHDSNFDLALYGTVHANGGNGNTLLARLQDQSSGPGKIQGFGNSGIFALACAQRGQIDPSFCRYP